MVSEAKITAYLYLIAKTVTIIMPFLLLSPVERLSF